MNRITFFIMICFFVFCGIPAEAAHILNVSIHNQDESPANAVQFPGINNLAVGGNLWIVSPQHLHVQYQSTETNWTIRLATRNNADIGGVYPKPFGMGADNQWQWLLDGLNSYQTVNGVWQTGDDVVSYGGLINNVSKLDPGMRAPLAWQVFRYNDPYNPPALHPHTGLSDNTVGGAPVDDWAYMGDGGDTGYVIDPLNNYFWTAYGSGSFSLLAQHPVVYWQDNNNDGVPDVDNNGNPIALPKPGGGEMILYVGARFGRKAPDGVNDVSVLPAGSYNTKIYIELIHW